MLLRLQQDNQVPTERCAITDKHTNNKLAMLQTADQLHESFELLCGTDRQAHATDLL